MQKVRALCHRWGNQGSDQSMHFCRLTGNFTAYLQNRLSHNTRERTFLHVRSFKNLIRLHFRAV